MYSYEEAYAASLIYFDGDDLATKVWLDKYALRNNEGEILEDTPDKMHWRLAKEFARIEKGKFKKPLTEEEIFNHLDHFKTICLQGSPMSAIGNPYQIISAGNCFVVSSPEDSYLGILRTDTEITQISSRRGGIGFDISTLRPINTVVKNAAKTTTGAVSFMHRFSSTIREVCQSGRRGAGLMSMSVHHPEILDFIKVKRDLTKVTGFNISVRFTNEFFDALEKNEEYELRWPVDSSTPKIRSQISAKVIWDEFITGARDYAEPGAQFVNTVWEESTSYPYRQYGFAEVASNPCGEQNLPKDTSCRLLLENLLGFVRNKYSSNAHFDYLRFYESVKILQRLGDDLVDLEVELITKIIEKIKTDPESESIKRPGLELWEKIRDKSLQDRRTGCGFTALGDTLAALGLKYDSDKAIQVTEKIQKTFKMAAFQSSVDMAKELGPFPLYNYELDKTSKFIERIKDESLWLGEDGVFEQMQLYTMEKLSIFGKDLYEEMKKYGRRNMTLLTIAPTGSVSCLTQTTSGLEPLFMLQYTRRKKGNPGDDNFRTDFVDKNGDHWMHFDVLHRGLDEWQKKNVGYTIEESPYWGATANDIDWKKRVEIQAILQKHIDNSISTTINLPEDVTKETVSDIYLYSYKKKCKGCTVYREKCRNGVLISNEEKKDKLTKTEATKRPKDLPCDIYNIKSNKQEYFVVVGLFDEDPYEIFLGKGKLDTSKTDKGKLRKIARGHYQLHIDKEIICDNIGDKAAHDEEIIARLLSTNLRHGGSVSFLVNQLEKTSGDLQCLYKIISRVLKRYIKDGTQVTGSQCPSCGNSELKYAEGCQSCECGWSKCG